MTDPPAPGARAANVVVLSSRPPSCRQGALASAWLEDLQEMHNQMMATLDRGMNELQSKQGQGGLPALPSGAAGTVDSPYAQAAQPDSNASAELNDVTQQADRDEQQALSEPTTAAVTPTLTMGLSIDDVKAIQGEPQTIVDLGTKKIYVYKNLKITFIDGKVTDIQ
jgi:hypothetical protein